MKAAQTEHCLAVCLERKRAARKEMQKAAMMAVRLAAWKVHPWAAELVAKTEHKWAGCLVVQMAENLEPCWVAHWEWSTVVAMAGMKAVWKASHWAASWAVYWAETKVDARAVRSAE